MDDDNVSFNGSEGMIEYVAESVRFDPTTEDTQEQFEHEIELHEREEEICMEAERTAAHWAIKEEEHRQYDELVTLATLAGTTHMTIITWVVWILSAFETINGNGMATTLQPLVTTIGEWVVQGASVVSPIVYMILWSLLQTSVTIIIEVVILIGLINIVIAEMVLYLLASYQHNLRYRGTSPFIWRQPQVVWWTTRVWHARLESSGRPSRHMDTHLYPMHLIFSGPLLAMLEATIKVSRIIIAFALAQSLPGARAESTGITTVKTAAATWAILAISTVIFLLLVSVFTWVWRQGQATQDRDKEEHCYSEFQ